MISSTDDEYPSDEEEEATRLVRVASDSQQRHLVTGSPRNVTEHALIKWQPQDYFLQEERKDDDDEDVDSLSVSTEGDDESLDWSFQESLVLLQSLQRPQPRAIALLQACCYPEWGSSREARSYDTSYEFSPWFCTECPVSWDAWLGCDYL